MRTVLGLSVSSRAISLLLAPRLIARRTSASRAERRTVCGFERTRHCGVCSSLADDTAATRRAIEQQTGPVALVGHSWGGVVLTEAGNDDKVKALVYVAALAPDSGASVNDLMKGKPAPAWAGELTKDSANYLRLSTRAVVDDFAQDLPPAQARTLAATQGPWFVGALDDKVSVAAWHTKPSWFVVADQGRMIDPRAEEAMATQIGVTTTHADSSHVVMLSHPQAVAAAIIAAATKVQ